MCVWVSEVVTCRICSGVCQSLQTVMALEQLILLLLPHSAHTHTGFVTLITPVETQTFYMTNTIQHTGQISQTATLKTFFTLTGELYAQIHTVSVDYMLANATIKRSGQTEDSTCCT